MSQDASEPGCVLVATDFSSTGTRTMNLAASLAKSRGAGICLLHVFEPPSVVIPELALDPQFEEGLRRQATLQLAAAAATLRARGLTVEERLEIGSPPAHVISDIAGGLHPQLVVLGSHGRRPLPRLLMGSVAEAALLRIKQPVLVVPSQEKSDLDLPTDRRWRIAVGVDLSNTTAAALDWVRELRASVACDVVLIHLYWPIAEYTRFGQRGPHSLFEADPATVALLERSLAPHLGTLPGVGETTLRILPSWGSLGERLIDEATHEKADLLVLGNHHRQGLARLWHGSTVPGALHAANLPVLCVSRSPHPAATPPIPRLRGLLAPTDLSDLGNQAIAHAYALARADRGVVHLLYVHERALPDPPYLYEARSDGALTPGQERELRARLLEQVPSEAAALGITTDVTIVDGGAPAEVICQTAERLGADAISLGSHGRGGLGRAVMGSVAARVLHHATIPVFVVRKPRDS